MFEIFSHVRTYVSFFHYTTFLSHHVNFLTFSHIDNGKPGDILYDIVANHTNISPEEGDLERHGKFQRYHDRHLIISEDDQWRTNTFLACIRNTDKLAKHFHIT